MFTLSKDTLDSFAVFWIIASSGFVVINYIFMIPCMIVLFSIALIYMHYNTKLVKDNLKILVGVFLFILIDEAITLLTTDFPFVLENMVIFFIRLISLAVIQSNIEINEFKKKYVNIVTAICAMCLICYVLVKIVGITLPFTGTYGDPNYYGTFYYQSKQNASNSFRNSGPYGEAGMFAITIILALTFVLFDSGKNISRKNLIKLVILVITLFTTQSGTGMLCFAIMLICYAMKDGFSLKNFRNPVMIVALMAMIIGFFFFESSYGIISGKILYKGGSYGVRIDDTMQGYSIGWKYFWFGTGICNDYSSVWGGLLIGSRSNGMANLVASSGYPFLMFYIYRLMKQCYEYTEKNFFYFLTLTVIVICIYNTQPVVIQTIGLSFIFRWKQKNRKFTIYERGNAHHVC